MERRAVKGKPCVVGYHTQDYSHTGQLEFPKLCTTDDAWLGVGYYFWTDLLFAHYWGLDFKSDLTGYYDIYVADLEIDNVINASFSEEGYFFLKNKIEETIAHFSSLGKPIQINKVHKYLSENIWRKLGVTGIIYDDLPHNTKKRTYSSIEPLYYQKRIQIVIFNKINIHNFDLFLEEQSA